MFYFYKYTFQKRASILLQSNIGEHIISYRNLHGGKFNVCSVYPTQVDKEGGKIQLYINHSGFSIPHNHTSISVSLFSPRFAKSPLKKQFLIGFLVVKLSDHAYNISSQ